MAETIAILVYKIVALLVGLSFAYMGYRLFMSNIWGQAGELDAQFGQNKILLKKAAPGTFFALFGAIVVTLTIWKGITYDAGIEMKPIDTPSQAYPSISELPENPPINKPSQAYPSISELPENPQTKGVSK